MSPRRRRKAGVGRGGSILPRKRGNPGVSNTSDGEGEKLPPPSVRQTSLQREMSYGKSTETTTMAPKKSKGGGATKLRKLQERGIVNKQSDEEHYTSKKLKQPPPVQHTSSSQPIVTTNKKSAVTSSFESSSDVSDNNSDYSSSSAGNAASSAAVGGRSSMQQHMFCNYRDNPHITCSNNASGLIECQGGGDEDCINYLHPSCMMKLEAHRKIQSSSKLSNHYLCQECHPIFGQGSSTTSSDEVDNQKPKAINNNSKKPAATNNNNNNNNNKMSFDGESISSDGEEEEEEGCGFDDCEDRTRDDDGEFELHDCYDCKRPKCIHIECMKAFLNEYGLAFKKGNRLRCAKCITSHPSFLDMFCEFGKIGQCSIPFDEEKQECAKCPRSCGGLKDIPPSEFHPSCYEAFHAVEQSPFMADGEQCCINCYKFDTVKMEGGQRGGTKHNNATSKKQSSRKSTANNAASVRDFLHQQGGGEEDECNPRSPTDRFDDIALQFNKAVKVDFNVLKKDDKLGIIRATVKQPLNELFKGVYREKAKQCYNALKRDLSSSNVTIKGIARNAMKLGKYLHENNCQDIDSCEHCDCEPKDHSMTRFKTEARQLKDCFEYCSTEVLDQERKKKDRNRKNAQKTNNPSGGKAFNKTMFTLAGFPPDFRYKSEMTDDQPCPVCGHDYVQKLHSEAEYAAEKKQLQQEFDQRMAKYNSLKTKAARESAGMKNPPRRTTKSKIPQKHFCPCWQLSGKRCPECKGNAPKVQDPNGKLGDKISSCPVCQCSCSVGPFKNGDRQDLHEQYELFCNAKGKSKTVSERSNPGVGNLTDMAQVAIQHASRDLMHMGKSNISTDDVQAAAVHYFNEMDMDDNTRHHASQAMGEPTEVLGGRHIQHYQRQRPTNGRRSYVANQSQQRQQQYHQLHQYTQQQQQQPQQQHAMQQQQQQSSSVKGVSLKRIKKRLRSKMLEGTPISKVAAEGIRTDIRNNLDSTAMEHIMEAQDESEPEEESDGEGNKVTASQQITDQAVEFKKLEFRRKKEYE